MSPKQASKVVVSFVTLRALARFSDQHFGGQSVQYGSNYTLRVDVENASGTLCQNLNTGAVTSSARRGPINLLDGGVP